MKKKYIIIPLIIALIAFILAYRYYNKEDAKTTLTINEKHWVEENVDKTIDFEIVNNYPLYGMNGAGVLFDFVKDFEKTVGIEFNKIPYLKETKPTTDSYRIRILDNNQKMTDKDLLIFQDGYVAIGKKYVRISHIDDLKNLTFGVFKNDLEDISYYLKSASNISYKSYDTIEDIYKALDSDEVNMVIVPNIMYLNYTISSDKYFINYYFTELTKNVVLTLGNDSELNNIVKKYYSKWKDTNYIEYYNDTYFNYYIKENKIGSRDRDKLVSKNYIYGYIENTPYEKKSKKKVSGIAGEYIDRIARLTDITFEYKKYKNIDELKKAIDNKQVDIYFDYYNLPTKDYLATNSTFIEDYVVISKNKTGNVVSSLESLKDKDVYLLKDNALYNYFKNNSKANLKPCKNINNLLSKADDNIIVLDREVYDYYAKKKFSKYSLLYTDTMMNDYKFMIKKNNKEFYDLFNYIIGTNSYYNYRNSGIDSLNASILENSTFEQVYTIALIVIFIPLLILLLLYLLLKYRRKHKKNVKLDHHKYTDMLTSLKNRNYLNVKINEWEEAKVYPRSVIMIDLNNVKYVNDNYGHEEGDKLIVKAASILVNTQLENSEIVRTDGNEFLIYLVGYSEKQIITYTKKLTKEFKSLPYSFGAAIGYSIITDEIKTLDDAINEATLEMITNKEDFK